MPMITVKEYRIILDGSFSLVGTDAESTDEKIDPWRERKHREPRKVSENGQDGTALGRG